MNGIKTVLACIRIADNKYNLINPGDRICVGISGGKDSMVLFYALHLYSKFSFNNFKIVPVIIDLGFDNFDPSPISKYLKELGYELKIYEAKTVFPILKANAKDGKHLPCSICSKMKKAIINKAAKLYKCNKVSFAHHVDDTLETLLMNAIYGGKIDTFSPKMYLTKDKMTFIRPLCLVHEKDIIKTIKENNIPVLNSICPADKHTERENIKELLGNLYKSHPTARTNFVNLLDNYEHFYLWQNDKVDKIEGTKIFYKKVTTVEDTIKLVNYMKKTKNMQELQGFLNYYLIYNGKKLIGFFSLNELNNKQIKLTKFKLEDNQFKELLINQIAAYVFKTYNPCEFIIRGKSFDFTKIFK